MTIDIALKNSKKAYLAKISFIIHWLNVPLVIKIMNMFLAMFGKAFKMNTMKEYHDLYWKVDVLLLGCVFETFRKESINFSELDPAYYLSTLGYSWDAMLRFTNVNLKLIPDIEKYQLLRP